MSTMAVTANASINTVLSGPPPPPRQSIRKRTAAAVSTRGANREAVAVEEELSMSPAEVEAESPVRNPDSPFHYLCISNHLSSSKLASCTSIIQGCYGQLNFMLVVTCLCCATYAWLMHNRAHELEERLGVYERIEEEGRLAATEIWAALVSAIAGVYWLKDVRRWRKEAGEEEEAPNSVPGRCGFFSLSIREVACAAGGNDDGNLSRESMTTTL